MDTYLVIGGTGVIGHYVTRQLVEQGYRPVVLTVSGNTSFIKDIVDRVELVKGDIRDCGWAGSGSRKLRHHPYRPSWGRAGVGGGGRTPERECR